MGRHSTLTETTDQVEQPVLARRVLAVALIIAAVVTVVGLIMLWPTGPKPEPQPGFSQTQSIAAESVTGTVVARTTGSCNAPDVGQVFDGDPRPTPPEAVPVGTAAAPDTCELSPVDLTSGPDKGRRTLLSASGLPGEITLNAGDKIILGISDQADPNIGVQYSFLDMDRSVSLWIWVGIMVVLIIAVGAMRGVFSLIGLALTLLAIFGFLVPALLRGESPTLVAVTAGSAVLFPVLFMVHGASWKTASALAGTLSATVLAAIMGNIAVSASSLQGLGDDNNLLIHLYLPDVSVTGLLIAGFIIGALGVLNDVTIAQASTVKELYDASPNATPGTVFAGAMRVGRDHIASLVYTLVLAYLGTALPLSMLLNVADRPLMQTLTSDVVATELLRSAVGAIALVLAVPITTGIAALTTRATTEGTVDDKSATPLPRP